MTKKVIYKFKGLEIMFSSPLINHVNSNKIKEINNRLEEITSIYQETIDSLSEDEKETISDLLNDTNDAFVNAMVTKKAKELLKNKDNAEEISKTIIDISKLIDEEKELKKKLKTSEIELENKSKEEIEKLSEEEIKKLLEIKWIKPITENIYKLVIDLINEFTKSMENLSKKYDTTLLDLEKEISNTESELSSLIDDLVGDEFDMKGLNEFKSLLNGGKYGE